MIVDCFITVKWNTANRKHYESLGYVFTHKNEEFTIHVSELQKTSSKKIKVICDYCGKEYETSMANLTTVRNRNKDVQKDCCNNLSCKQQKQKETNLIRYGFENALSSYEVKEKIKQTNIERYGVENVFSSEQIKDKIKQANIEKYGVEYAMQNKEVRERASITNLEKYGSENVFASEQIKEKIKRTNLEKYGVEHSMQNEDIKNKAIQTCMERYGVPSYGVIYSAEHKGELSPVWKGGVEYHRVERSTNEYREWRKSVFDRDMYTCQCCGDRSGNGHNVELHSHHIKNWKDNIYSRYDINNGITLCDKCHYKFHSLYGKHNNTKEQLEEFLKNNKLDKKIC